MAESSFDVVSSVDMQEVKNAIAQAMKEITTRFDLKGTGSDVSLAGEEVVLWRGPDGGLVAQRDRLAELERGFGVVDRLKLRQPGGERATPANCDWS